MKDMSANIASLRQFPRTGETAVTPKTGVQDSAFREKLSALQEARPANAPSATQVSARLKFSNHAIERMRTRGMQFSSQEMNKIENAVSKAAAKGAKETLLLTDTSALIVSVKDNTVVTVMDKASLKDNVFTNIDSTVMI